jgi:bleomycin hydrolase
MKIHSFQLSRTVVLAFATLISTATGWAQSYEFETLKDAACTPVKSQDNTGTCWSYSTISFLESELIRMGKGNHDLSEMFNACMIYEDKAANFVRRQGKAQFSQGSLGHDVLRVVAKYGVVPQEHYSGLLKNTKTHNHEELEAVLTAMVKTFVASEELSPFWKEAVAGVLDAYLGRVPQEFTYNGKKHTPVRLRDELGIKPEDYVSISSFTHHPFYKSFVLEVADNYSNGSFYNVPLDELVKTVDFAIENGYTLAWDADVSEKGFSSKHGIAIIPEKDWNAMNDEEVKKAFTGPVAEKSVTQEMRQQEFDVLQTTDDHLMHITGKVKDQKGNVYYIVKNSWGEGSGKKGFVYVSLAYLRLKTISVLLHKDGVPKDTRKQLAI